MDAYNAFDVLEAEHTLSPLRCLHCDCVGTVTWNQACADGKCDTCGLWQLEEVDSLEDKISNLMDEIERRLPKIYHRSDEIAHANDVLKFLNGEYQEEEGLKRFLAGLDLTEEQARNNIVTIMKAVIQSLEHLIDSYALNCEIKINETSVYQINVYLQVRYKGATNRIFALYDLEHGEVVTTEVKAGPLTRVPEKLRNEIQEFLNSKRFLTTVNP